MMNHVALHQQPFTGLTPGQHEESLLEESLTIECTVRLSHLAWVLTELIRIGVRLNRDGWCLGATRPAETVISVSGINRARARWCTRPLQSLRGYIHARWFHDAGCEAVGISLRMLRKWIKSARLVRGGVLLEEAYVAAVEEILRVRQSEHSAYEAWSQVHGDISAEDIVMLHVMGVITPESPWNTKESPSRSSRTPNRVLRRKKR